MFFFKDLTLPERKLNSCCVLRICKIINQNASTRCFPLVVAVGDQFLTIANFLSASFKILTFLVTKLCCGGMEIHQGQSKL